MPLTPERIDDYSDRPEIIKMLTETRTCLNCGHLLPRGHHLSPSTGYCSRMCHYAKPPKMAYLEHVHGKPAREVIIETLNSNNNVTMSAELLGISRFTMFQWLKKLNIGRHVEWR